MKAVNIAYKYMPPDKSAKLNLFFISQPKNKVVGTLKNCLKTNGQENT